MPGKESSLNDPAFRPVKVTEFRPQGWLRTVLERQADTLSGRLDEFWPDVKESRWFGGKAEAWERAPYWLDGVSPLAFVLQDEALLGKVRRYIDYIVTHQHEDGWLGPREMIAFAGAEARPSYDIWAQFLAAKVLTEYSEAAADERASDAVMKVLRNIDLHIDKQPLFNWGQFRWFESLIPIYAMYEKSGEQWLIDLAVKLHAQGFDWRSFFTRWPLTDRTPRGRWNFMGHVVNNAMAIKAHGLWWRLTGDDRDRLFPSEMIALLDRFHGMASGVFSGDECVAGLSPVQGTELCAVVEYMYSLEILLSVVGDSTFGDRLEKIAFNALPATFSPDMWSHQYDQQVNQIECSVKENRTWTSNGSSANIFGVEPNFGCCTANLSQGWPKFAAHLWMRSADGGLVAAAYAPGTLTTSVEGAEVSIQLATDYPFSEELNFTVTTSEPVEFPLYFRIPSWTLRPTLTIGEAKVEHPLPGTFHRTERMWQGETRLKLRLTMRPALSKRPLGAVSVERGPLVYALPIGEQWKRVNEDKPYREPPHADWEIYPTTPWNYGLEVDPERLESQIAFEERPTQGFPFSPDAPPVTATVSARRLPQWTGENGSAHDVPAGPIASEQPAEQVKLIPYGCTNLRIAEFPLIER